MRLQEFEIPIRFKSFNTYAGMSIKPQWRYKRDVQEEIVWRIRAGRIKRVKHPVFVTFVWYEDRKGREKARDKDNVAYAKKFILDAMQERNILPDDNDQWILGFADYFIYGQGQKVVVKIQEVDEANEVVT